MKFTAFLILAMVVASLLTPASAATYECPVTHKFGGGEPWTPYSEQMMAKWKYRVQIIETSGGATMLRCSGGSCDSYEADYIHVDQHTNIKKYYYFSGHYDVQIYPDGLFVENNGRGGIAFGYCNMGK